jgi:hypothetical protein
MRKNCLFVSRVSWQTCPYLQYSLKPWISSGNPLLGGWFRDPSFDPFYWIIETGLIYLGSLNPIESGLWDDSDYRNGVCRYIGAMLLHQPFCNYFVFENYFQVVVNIFKGHLQWLERTTLLANGLCCIMCQKLWRLVSISASRGAEVSYTASWLELWWHNWPAWLRPLSLQWIENISEHFLIH